jgi:hypothetical protein
MSEAPKVRAVLVGVGKPFYWPSSEDLGNGAVADVEELADLLERKFGAEVECLPGSRATKKAVVDAVKTLAKSCREDDIAVLYFGGHGIRKSHRDVAFAVFDTAWLTKSNKDVPAFHDTVLTTAELTTALAELPAAARIEAIFDTCFAGRATYGLAKVARAVPARAGRIMIERNRWAIPTIVKEALENEERRYVLWLSSAGNAQSFQRADASGRMRGAFTLDLLSALRYSIRKTSRGVSMKQIEGKLARAQHPQKPHLTVSKEHLRQDPIFRFDLGAEEQALEAGVPLTQQ